jgi:Fe-S-cluster containining protein
MFVDVSEYLERLSSIYKKVDKAYCEIAESLGFNCKGCDDLCCNNVFIHFTVVESFFLIDGFRRLSEDKRQEIFLRAEQYNRAYASTSRPVVNLKELCPLNYDGLCILYEYRPIACRLYGLPGKLISPARGTEEFRGCWRFEKLFSGSGKSLDRTPFYAELAALEGELRKKLCYYQKYKKTIAQILLDEKNPDGLIPRNYDFFEGY